MTSYLKYMNKNIELMSAIQRKRTLGVSGNYGLDFKYESGP